jgi:hypothetical protein
MRRSSPLSGWAWSVWGLVAVACSSASTLPPPIPDCNGSKATTCSVQPGGGGGSGSAGGTGDAAATTVEDAEATGSCTTAASQLGATSQNCQPCIETGAGSSTGVSCCIVASNCLNNAACQEIINCNISMLCGPANGTCTETCVDQFPLGATLFNDFDGCLMGCSPECPTFSTMASEQ